MEYPVQIELKEIKFEFRQLPVKVSFDIGWNLFQKIISSCGKSLKAIKSSDFKKDMELEKIIVGTMPVLGEAIESLVNNFSNDDITKFIKIHSPYIKASSNEDQLTDLNIDFHFSGKPELIILLFVKIVEVYYKSFFIESLALLEIKERMGLVMKKVATLKPAKTQEKTEVSQQ